MNPSVIPCLSYADAPKAIGWLCAAFGFEKHLVVPDANGGIAHSQLTVPGGMIMVGSKRPEQTGANGTIYVVVKDPAALRARAAAAGADVGELVEHDYGGCGFPVSDLEGTPWYFGSYDPLDPATHAG